MKRNGFAIAFFALAACSGPTPTSSIEGLAASADAQRFGVARYVAEGGAISAFDHDGGVVGVLHVSAPTNATRLVTIDYVDAGEVELEIERPMQDGSFLVGLAADRSGAILTDPALSTTFAAAQLRFAVRQEGGRRAQPLGTSTVALCSDISFVSICRATLCDYEQIWGSSVDYFIWDTDSGCTMNGFVSGSCSDNGEGYYDCWCDRIWTDARRFADCAVSSACTPSVGSDGCDVVAKRRHCEQPGSCVSVADGTVGCGFHNDCEIYR